MSTTVTPGRAVASRAAELQPLEPRPALGSRRRAPVDGDGALERSPLGSYGARVVARIRLLLVRRIVLLVHADDAEAAHRREHGGARADDDPRLPRRDPLTLVAPLRLREPGVEHRHEVAETGAEATERLRRERDLGNEDDGVAAAGDGRRTGAEVDLGLTAARLAPEQEVAAAGSQRLLDAPDARPPAKRSAPAGASSAASAYDSAGARRSPRRARAGGATSASARAGVEP